MQLKFIHPPRAEWRKVAMIYGVTFGLMLLIIMASWGGGYSLKSLLRHPASATQNSPLVGSIFNLGVLMWAAAAAVCGFCYLFLREEHNTDASFFLCSSLVTSMLMLDKLFEMNDYVFPRYLGIGEGRAYIVYGLILALYLFKFRHIFWRTNLAPLYSAFAFWAVAIFLDLSYLFLPFYFPRWVYLAKDILKLFGIVGWTTYFVMAGMDVVRAGRVQYSQE